MTSISPHSPWKRDIYTVSRLVREARDALEDSFPLLWIEGEISNLSRPASGHLYFTLKDSAAQVRCAMFRGRNRRLRFRPEDGMRVLLRGRVGLYEARGEFQLIVEHLEGLGDGALQRAFEALKQRLAAEGLFAAERKRSLPLLPRRIGVITSATGAAIRDILSTLKRRFPAVPVFVYPVPVQGEEAARRIAAALAKAEKHGECDVLILARGGGSLEDLWAFNEERLARAIDRCTLPIISGVGHEIDFTITDFAADRRAPTPSGAAEMAVPDSAEWYQRFRRAERRLHFLLQQSLRHQQQLLGSLTKHLRHPDARLQEFSQRADELEQRLRRAHENLLSAWTHRLKHRVARLQGLSPARRLEMDRLRLTELQRRLRRAEQQWLERRKARLAIAQRALQAFSPQATLERGYAIATEHGGKVLYNATQVQPGDRVEIRLAQGRVHSRATKIIEP